MLQNKRFCAIIFFAVFLLTGCGEKIEPGNVEPSKKERVKAPVVSAKIIIQPFFYESVGTVSAKTVSTISSKLMGSVREVFVREGDHVNRGDRLANIDDRFWCSACLFFENFKNQYHISIDSIDYAPCQVFIIYPQFMTFRAD